MNSLSDKNLELSTIGCCIMDNTGESSSKVAVELTSENFEHYKNEFMAIKSLVSNSQSVDVVTFVSQLPYTKDISTNLISSITKIHLTSAFIDSYITRLKEYKFRRDVMKYANSLKESITGSHEDLINNMAAVPQSESTGHEHKETREIVQNTIEDMIVRCKSKSQLRGLSTTFNDLDHITDGMKEGELILVEADPNVGKSIIAMNIGMRLATKGHRVDYFSYEMTTKQIGYRMSPALFDVPVKKISFPGDLEEEDNDKIEAYDNKVLFDNFNIYAEELSARTVDEIKFKVKNTTLQKNKRPELVIIDYLQILNGKGDEWERAGNNVRALKRYATEMNIPIILIVSKAKDGTVRGSGQITFDADQRWDLEREHDSDELEKRMDTTLTIKKCRDGGKGKVKLIFMEQLLKFEEVDRKWKYQG